jgi:hypothetical protein
MATIGMWIAISPDVIGKILGRFVDGKINSNQLVSMLKTTPIKFATTSHSQNYAIETKWGFWYGGVWKPEEVTVDYGNKKAEENKYDILNLISTYSNELGYKTSICCE